MSTIRKVDQLYRIARQKRREAKVLEIQQADLENYQRMLKLGLIKAPVFRERNARMAMPREDLVKRIMETRAWARGKSEEFVRAALAARGIRMGYGEPIEIVRLLPKKKAAANATA